MYKVNETTAPLFLTQQLPGNRTDLEKQYCAMLDGYSYDQRQVLFRGFRSRSLSDSLCNNVLSEMKSTAVSDNDWVCDKMKRATDLFTLGVVGLILGTFFFSAFADWKGRRPAFFISTAFMIVFCLVGTFVSQDYGAYLALKVSFMATWPQ